MVSAFVCQFGGFEINAVGGRDVLLTKICKTLNSNLVFIMYFNI